MFPKWNIYCLNIKSIAPESLCLLYVVYRIKWAVLHVAAPCLQFLLSSNTNLLWFTHPCNLPKWQLQTLRANTPMVCICPQPIVWRMSQDCSLTFHFTAITFHQAHSQNQRMTYGGVGQACWPSCAYGICFRILWTLSSPSNLIRHFPNRSSVQLHLAGAFGRRRTQALEASSQMGWDKHDRCEKHTSLVGLNTRSQWDSQRLNGISKAHQSLLPGTAPANTPQSKLRHNRNISIPLMKSHTVTLTA